MSIEYSVGAIIDSYKIPGECIASDDTSTMCIE
jgi:hypothetical protein